jgi:hypothetical protein
MHSIAGSSGGVSRRMRHRSGFTARSGTAALRRLRRLAAGVALAAMAAAGPADAVEAVLRGPDGGEVRALVIGIDAYRNVRPLKGAVADAKDIDSALRRMGVRDVTALIDGDSERAAVLAAIEKLTQRSRPGDLVVLTIAGHGAQEPEKVKGSQPDGMDDIFLLPGFDVTPQGSQQRIVGREFNHIIKQLEARGARVLFVADTCHGGGLTREIDPRAPEMSFRQVPRYTIPVDELKPISTEAEAFLTELDFEKTTFLAAVDRSTKAPEVRIPGIPGYRGALSYAMARAFEGQADANGDGKVTLRELFSGVRHLVYTLSDQRQNAVTVNSPNRDIDTDVAFALVRSVTVLDGVAKAPAASGAAVAAPAPATPQGRPAAVASTVPSVAPAPAAPPATPPAASPPSLATVRLAALGSQRNPFAGIAPREVPFEVVAPGDAPDLVWDPKSRDVIAGGDVVAFGLQPSELPGVIDRTAAVGLIKQLAARAPQGIRILPNDRLHRNGREVGVEVAGVAGRGLILFNIAGDGTVQALYPVASDPPIFPSADYRLAIKVRGPFGADQVVAVTSAQPMPALEQALRKLDQRRSALQIVRMVERLAPADARIGTTGLFTAP